MIRTLFTLFALALLTGCTLGVIAPAPVPPDPAESLFLTYLEGPASDRTEALARLNAEYSQSPWAARAQRVSDMRAARDSQGQRVRLLEQEKTRCLQEKESLEEEARRLRDDLEKLKKLLIDMEMRSTR